MEGRKDDAHLHQQSVTLPNGVNVQYDGIKAVKLNADALDESEEHICGICGNNDGSYNGDDFLQGNNVNGGWCPGYFAPGPRFTTVNYNYTVAC
jgi:hypothetical protein